MPLLTGKQRLALLVRHHGARRGLEELLSMTGVQPDPGGATLSGQGPASGAGQAPQLVVLPSWITDVRAAQIVEHFLHGTLLLPWQHAPWWQAHPVAEGWPMVGAIPSMPIAPMAGGGGVTGASQPAPAGSLGSGPAGGSVADSKATLAPPAVPPQLWQQLVDQWGDTAWLWARYKPYFLPTGGQPALLSGVLLAHEVGQGAIALPGIPKAGGDAPSQEVDCFAFTLSVAIGVLEETDFATVHNAAPEGYPSQWQAPEPPFTLWRSPLHGDNRFWHEFDEPPTDEPQRFVKQGLTRQEAVRVWARRVAICLWADANGHWGRWPWRLATTSAAMRRRLLGWDPLDVRLVLPETNTAEGYTGSARYGFQNTAAADEGDAGSFGLFDAFGQMMWPNKSARGGRGSAAIGTVYQSYSIWDTNPYLAWSFAWRVPAAGGATAQSRPRAAKGSQIDAAVGWVTALFQSMGMWHGPGWLYAKPIGAASKKYESWYTDPSVVVCSLAEILDLNMGGCHTNAMVALSLLRSQCVPVAISHDCFVGVGGANSADAVPSTLGEARFVEAHSLNTDGDTDTLLTGHASLVAGFDGIQRVVQHSDRLLADRLGVFADTSQIWVPFEEHMLVLTGLNAKEWLLEGVQRCAAAHEFERTRTVVVNAGKHWATRRAAAMQLDKQRAAMVTPFATSRLAWFRAAERTLKTSLIRTFAAGPWLEQAQGLLSDASKTLPLGSEILAAMATTAAAQKLAARLLGIDSRFVWPGSGAGASDSEVKKIPSVVEQAVLGLYLSAAPSPLNFRFTGSVGQYPYNYRAAEASSSDDPASVHGILVFAFALLQAASLDEETD